MAYNPTTGILSQPVGVGDIQQCLGCGSGDLFTLCTRPNINMWSNVKPVYNSKVGELSDTDRATARVITGYKTGGGILKWAGTYAQFKANMDSNGTPTSQLWEHDKPQNDGVCAVRYSDFKGYYHLVPNVFVLYNYLGNLDDIPIPSSGGQTAQGRDIQFMAYSRIVDGCIRGRVLFGDVLGYYPCVVMTCGSGTYHYAKTTDQPISGLFDSQNCLNASILINTADFASAIASDWRSSHTGDPYANYPLRTGDNWTFTMVLSSRQLTGASGVANHNFNSNDTIVRLEYAAGVDRSFLPIKQAKYNVITGMYMNVELTKQANQNGHMVYKITSIAVFVTKTASSSTIQFTCTASIQCAIGIVNMQGIGQSDSPGQSVTGYVGTVSYPTAAGTSSQSVQIPTTTYEITSTTAGNQLCNGTITLYNSTIGTFSGVFSIDVSQGSNSYVRTNINLL